MNQGDIVSSLMANAIITTAYLANEICIQTNGAFIIPETDYLHLVKDFQFKTSKRIMPITSHEDLKEEAKKFIGDLLLKSKKETEDESDNGLSEDNSSDRNI